MFTNIHSCLQERWLSVLHHVANEHQWITLQCDHAAVIGPPRDGHGNVLQYFDKREPAFKALQKLALDRQWLKSLEYYTKFR